MLRITEADGNEQMGNGPWNMLHMVSEAWNRACVKASPTPLPGTGPMTTFMLGTQQECVCDHGESRNCEYSGGYWFTCQDLSFLYFVQSVQMSSPVSL